MKSPDITHLQFQVLGILMNGERSGQSVRDDLRNQGVRKTGPGFYQLMARLEGAGMVKGWYQPKETGGQVVKERWYSLTSLGSKAWRSTDAFYTHQKMLVNELRVSHG